MKGSDMPNKEFPELDTTATLQAFVEANGITDIETADLAVKAFNAGADWAFAEACKIVRDATGLKFDFIQVHTGKAVKI
jgi:hypothetical protein